MTRLYVTLSKQSPNLEALEVVENRDKSYKVRNVENNATCFVPKSGLKQRKPGVAGYEDEFVLAPWFRAKLSYSQERVLGVCE